MRRKTANVNLENKKHPYYKCASCDKIKIKHPRFSWVGMISGNKILICRDCAYRAAYGTKFRSRAKKEKWLENE